MFEPEGPTDGVYSFDESYSPSNLGGECPKPFGTISRSMKDLLQPLMKCEKRLA